MTAINLKLVSEQPDTDMGYSYLRYSIRIAETKVGLLDVMVSVDEDGQITEAEIPYLERIDIDEDHQGKGYGTQAVYAIKEALGVMTIVSAPDNANCQRWMQKIGEETRHDVQVDQGFGVYDL